MSPSAVPRVARRRLRLALMAVVAIGGLVGCGNDAAARGAQWGLPSDVAETLDPNASPTASAATASPTPGVGASVSGSPTPSSAPATSARPPAGEGTRPGPGGCPRRAGLSRSWASWPMPNARGSGSPNPASYTNLGDGTVRDDVTCLVWQRQPAPEVHTFAAAKAYCESLSLAGGGWHLPSRVELTSIVDVGRVGPAIDTAAFPGTPSAFFWTSTPWTLAHTPPFAWIINFYEGLASNAADQTKAFRVRCVRSPGGSGAPGYRVLSAEQVQDPYTGLIWQRSTSPATMGAAQALEYCRGLGLAGERWRLPSVKELATTVDDSKVAPAIDRVAFPGTAKSTWYWSSSVAKADAARTWALNYDDGFTNYRNIAAGFVRCVR